MSLEVKIKGKLPDVKNFKKEQLEKSKRDYPGFRRNLVNYVQQYTDYTGIHGFRYMGVQDRSIFERLFWCISFCISLWLCVTLIMETWNKWNLTPVIVSFAKSPTSVWTIPFPAVTVCPQTKFSQTVYNYTDAYDRFMYNGSLNEEEMKNFSASSLVCDNYLDTKGSKTIDLDAINHIMQVAPELPTVLLNCIWTLGAQNCSKVFTKILTEDGVCFTSNMLGRSQLFKNRVYLHDYTEHGMNIEGWSLEDGYPVTAKRDTFPRRAMSSGFQGSQVLLLADHDENLNYVCKSQLQGFKIILHHPAEIPRVSMRYYQAPLNQELLISITPEMMTTSKALEDYDPHKRECFFPKEKYLHFFQSYTQQNCDFECLTNYTLSKCGCAAYYMPHEESTPVCGPGALSCIREAQLEIMGNDVASGLSELNDQGTGMKRGGCDCLPACTSLIYNGEFSQSDFNWLKVYEGLRENMSETIGLHLTRLTIFFKEQQFITSERNELYGLTDFLANCGGILGLFTGFSFLSIVEIVYFLSLRLMCNLKRYGRHYWSGSSELIKNDAYVHY